MKKDPVLTKSKFRLLLIASLLCIFISAILDVYNERSIAVSELLATEPQNWEILLTGLASIIAVIMLAGLFFFKAWARTLYLYSYFPLLLLYLLPSFSWTFISGLGAIFYEMGNIFATLIWGILLLPSLYQPLFSTNSE
ncbi:hypothetical protein F892_03775 [Acinetobacter vivianii]|uniref:Uncharacterized protein n=1 Tax=Acinetobacter vivianii TaxID=1776742 RepID=N9PXW7_9GAMM|nr:hypothetical protein [Acinetobacter vivianii]ENX19602.1 hypothetical protein F892_03775 [Acinetobacter vivianii]GGI61995.1 hypothetical protein GCM10011446_34900 [Acinetobacter vivianii]